MEENKNPLGQEIQNMDSLYEHHAFIADPGQSPLRIDKFLMSRIENVTRSKIQQSAKEGSIYVNDLIVKSNYKVKGRDRVKVLFAHPPYENLLVAEDIAIDIVYEDDILVVINKPPGLVVHPGHGNYSGTLINALLYHFENLPQRNQDYFGRPGLVHRLDKHTTGLLVIAKTEHALTHLAKQFYDRTTERRYWALVWGDVEEDGTVTGHLGRSLKNRKVMAVFPEGDQGKHAVTHYKVLKRY